MDSWLIMQFKYATLALSLLREKIE